MHHCNIAYITAQDGPASPLMLLAISMGGDEFASCLFLPKQRIADPRDALAKDLALAFKRQLYATSGEFFK